MDITAEERERCLKIHLGHRFSRGDTDDSDSSNMSDNGEFDEEYEFWKPDPIPPEVIRRYAISPPLKQSTEVVDKKEFVVQEPTAEKEISGGTQTMYSDMVEKFNINVRGLVDELRMLSGHNKKISFNFIGKLQKFLKKVETFEEDIETFQAEAEQLEISSRKTLHHISKSKILLSKCYAFIFSECLIVEKELKDGNLDLQKFLKKFMKSLKKYDLEQKLQLRNSMKWNGLSGHFKIGCEVPIRLTNSNIMNAFPATNQEMRKIPEKEEKLESNSRPKLRRRERRKNAETNNLPETVIEDSNINRNQIKTSTLETEPVDSSLTRKDPSTQFYSDTTRNFGFSELSNINPYLGHLNGRDTHDFCANANDDDIPGVLKWTRDISEHSISGEVTQHVRGRTETSANACGHESLNTETQNINRTTMVSDIREYATSRAPFFRENAHVNLFNDVGKVHSVLINPETQKQLTNRSSEIADTVENRDVNRFVPYTTTFDKNIEPKFEPKNVEASNTISQLETMAHNIHEAEQGGNSGSEIYQQFNESTGVQNGSRWKCFRCVIM